MAHEKWERCEMGRLGLSHVVYAPGGYSSETHPGGPSSFTDDEWIDAFYNRYSVWVLRVAEELLQNDPHSGFAVLLILFPYFEMIARYHEGRVVKPFRKGFEMGMYHVFKESELGDTPKTREGVIEWLWVNMRNDLAHAAFPGRGIAISGGYPVPMVWELDKEKSVVGVGFNPHLWVERIRQDFERYINILRNPVNTAERSRFLKYAKRYTT
jgi:hypothetical protein